MELAGLRQLTLAEYTRRGRLYVIIPFIALSVDLKGLSRHRFARAAFSRDESYQIYSQ